MEIKEKWIKINKGEYERVKRIDYGNTLRIGFNYYRRIYITNNRIKIYKDKMIIINNNDNIYIFPRDILQLEEALKEFKKLQARDSA